MNHVSIPIAALCVVLAGCSSASAPEPTDEAAVAAPAGTPAVEAEAPAAEPEPTKVAFAEVSPDEVDTLVQSHRCTPVDANGASTREEYGTLPGAVLLSGSNFDLSELPENKQDKLVFYCGGPACSAAPSAAERALAAGYADVAVMREGIRGWVDAGKNVEKQS